MSVGVVIGTRPECIKLMPVVRALARHGVACELYVTGQHRDLLQPILSELQLEPTENLDVMDENQALAGLSARVVRGMDDLLSRRAPQILVVQGDTTSAAMAALAAFYRKIKVAHVEAGLRTHNRHNPFPEEMNRRLIGQLADIHFAPTPAARQHLLDEGVVSDGIHLVGNTVIDALFEARDHLIDNLSPDPAVADILAARAPLVLITGHRRENFGPEFEAMCKGIRRTAELLAGKVHFVYPVHPNPNVRAAVAKTLSGAANVRVIAPLSYLQFVKTMINARLIITDSGGVQEEAAALGIPVLVTRRTCERMEAVEAGVAQIVGPDEEAIFAAATHLLTDEHARRARARPTEAFGDGRAAERIVLELKRNLS